MKKSIILFAIAIFYPSYISAQSEAGSPYSTFGLGILQDNISSQTLALGSTGIGLRSDLFLNSTNPSALNAIRQPTTMMMGFGFNVGINHLESEKDEYNYRNGGLSNFDLWFRFNRKWAGSIGLSPYSKVAYSITTDRHSETLGGDYRVNYKGSGGLSKLHFGQAYEIARGLSLGANVNFLFGSLNRTEELVSQNGNFDFELTSKTHLQDLNYDLGLQYSLSLSLDRKITIGAVYAPATNLYTNQDVVLTKASDEIDENPNIDDYSLPEKVGGGISFQGKKLTLATDVVFQKWSEAKLNTDEELLNTLTFSGGAEYAPFNSKYRAYGQSVLLRLGFSIQNNYLKIDGQNFYTWRASTGISVPFNRSQHHAHLTYTFSQNGTKDAGLFLENKHQIAVNFSLRDIWFVKRKFQ